MPWIVLIVVVVIAGIVYEGYAMKLSGLDTTADYTPSIVAFAKAIAKAEGFGVPGAIPTLANNPGDLVIPGWTGEKLGSAGISVFSNPNDGWTRLYNELQMIVNGSSSIYSPEDTIDSMAVKWTATDPESWALIVSSTLGIPSDTTLQSALGG